jgi:hypothetical protein
MSNTREKAIDRFMALVRKIDETLDAIREANDDHYDLDPENVTWANVGDVQRTLDALKEVLAVIRGEDI